LRSILFPSIAVALLATCSHPTIKGGGDSGTCTPGTELCACLAGGLCTGDLVCGSNLCVRIIGVGNGGTGGSVGDDAAASGTGGTGGSGQGGGGGTVTGTNLVTNGDFTQGQMFWKYILNGGGNDSHGVTNVMFCAAIGNQSVTIGWDPSPGPALMLASGTHYRFSYKASASTALITFTSKVGHAVDPFGTDFQQDVQVPTNLTSFMHDFTPNNPDDQTGIAFIIQGPNTGTSNVCIDDVSLVAN